jgi:FkbM family methyltransferase
MTVRDCVHAAGRILTRGLLHPRLRRFPAISWTYCQLYLVGKRLTERRELATLRSLIRPGMVIADIGANAGFYALEMAASVGPSGRILAFEPDPLTFRLLQERLKGAATPNVEAYQVALGDTSGRATLYCSAYNRADNRLSPSHIESHVEACEVEVCRLDEFLARRQIQVDALKIDVQGNEAQVLRGAQAILRVGIRWIWVEFSPDHLRGSGSDPERFLESLGTLGMELFEVNDHGTLEPVTDYCAHTAKIGSSYGDLVLKARPSPASSTL